MEVLPGKEVTLPPTHATQSVSSSLPSLFKYLPAGHFLHALAPDSLEYLPASHPIHVAEPFTAEKVPASHSVQLLASLPENVPVPHCKQEVMSVAFE
jgi:hypothetical protein